MPEFQDKRDKSVRKPTTLWWVFLKYAFDYPLPRDEKLGETDNKHARSRVNAAIKKSIGIFPFFNDQWNPCITTIRKYKVETAYEQSDYPASYSPDDCSEDDCE